MNCTQCHFEFCWVCGGEIGKDWLHMVPGLDLQCVAVNGWYSSLKQCFGDSCVIYPLLLLLLLVGTPLLAAFMVLFLTVAILFGSCLSKCDIEVLNDVHGELWHGATSCWQSRQDLTCFKRIVSILFYVILQVLSIIGLYFMTTLILALYYPLLVCLLLRILCKCCRKPKKTAENDDHLESLLM